ncbi:MAG: hypothetical protein ACE5FN_07180 [Leptospirillia bacterium]
MRVFVITLLALALFAVPAQAKKFVYSPIVAEGEKELEYYTDWRETPAGVTVVSHELEFVYAYAARDQIAFYGVWEDQSGADVHFSKYKVEWIHQMFEQGERDWDVGFYLEYQMNENPPDKIEFKPLFAKDFGKTTLTLNGIFERTLGATATGGTEVGYAVEWKWRMSSRVQPAIQAHGGFGEARDFAYAANSQVIGPVVKMKLSPKVGWRVGALFGTTDGSEDVRVTSNLAYEWF